MAKTRIQPGIRVIELFEGLEAPAALLAFGLIERRLRQKGVLPSRKGASGQVGAAFPLKKQKATSVPSLSPVRQGADAVIVGAS